MHDVPRVCDWTSKREVWRRTPSLPTYLRCARRFLAGVGIPVRKVKRDDVRQYLAGLRTSGITPTSRNVYLHAIRFLFSTTLRRPGVTDGVRHARIQPKAPMGTLLPEAGASREHGPA